MRDTDDSDLMFIQTKNQQNLYYGGAEVQSPAWQAVAPWWLAGDVSPAHCAGAYKPVGAASLADSYSNYANPALPCWSIGANPPVHDPAMGWVSVRADDQCLDTGIVGSTQNWSFLYRYSGHISGNDPIIFGAWPNQAFYLYLDSYIYFYNFGSCAAASPGSAAVIGIAGKTAYINGAPAGIISAGTGMVGSSLKMISTVITDYGLTGSTQAVAIYNTPLTDVQVAAISAEMAGL